MDRAERIEVFDRTMEQCRSNETLIRAVKASVDAQEIIRHGDRVEVSGKGRYPRTDVVLSGKRTYEAARPYALQGKRVCALNFASYVVPGGGVVKGASAQEESMCRISTLYPAIADEATAGEFYSKHREVIRAGNSCRRNTDDSIFTPGVVVICEDTLGCEPLPEGDWYSVDVITCAAPDLRYTDDGTMYRPDEKELCDVFESRWRRICAIAAAKGAEVLILGAFGCGAFGNPPHVVVEAFNRVLPEFEGCFETVEFAVYTRDRDRTNYYAFKKIAGIDSLQ